MAHPMDNVPLQWANTEPTGLYGEGLSRPKTGARTREYRLRVKQPMTKALIWYTRAESKRHAIRYAENRWLGAAVEVAA